jgi:hypothetical protein
VKCEIDLVGNKNTLPTLHRAFPRDFFDLIQWLGVHEFMSSEIKINFIFYDAFGHDGKIRIHFFESNRNQSVQFSIHLSMISSVPNHKRPKNFSFKNSGWTSFYESNLQAFLSKNV